MMAYVIPVSLIMIAGVFVGVTVADVEEAAVGFVRALIVVVLAFAAVELWP